MPDAVLTTESRLVRSPLRPGWAVDCAMLLAFAAVLRFLLLGRTSLWSDEIFSVGWSALDIDFITGPGNQLETNPPAYYLLLKAWMGVFGTSAYAIRAMSALFATLTVPVAYLLGRRLQGRMLGLVGGILLALSPDMIAQSQEARGYSLLALLSSLSLFGLGEALGPDKGKRLAAMGLFALGAIGAFLVHYTAVFFIAACFVAVALRLFFGPERFSWKSLQAWAATGVIITLAIAWPLRTAMTMSHSANLDWIKPLSLNDVWSFFFEIFLGRAGHGVAATTICLVLMGALLVGIWRHRPTGVSWQILVVVPAAFILILLAVSLWRPMFLSRTGAWLTTPLSLLLAWFALGLTPRLARNAAVAVTALTRAGFSFKVYTRAALEDWRAMANFVATDPKCQGPLVVIGPYVLDLEHYDTRLADRPTYWTRLFRDQAETAEAALNTRETHATPLNPDDVEPLLREHPDAVVVVRHALDRFGDAALGRSTEGMSLSHEEAGMHVFCR